MSIVVCPATTARFDDVATMLGSKCWCLSHRLDWKTNRALAGRTRGEYVKKLCSRTVAPGVLAHCDGEVAGWAAVAPRSELPFARSARIPHVDDLPAWSVWFIRIRPGCRGRGISHALLDGAVACARSQGAPAVEGYPVDNQGKRVDLTMAYVGNPQALRGRRLHQGRRHRLGLWRVPARGDAAGPALTGGVRTRSQTPLERWNSANDGDNAGEGAQAG